MDPKTLLPLIVLNDLSHSAREALKHKHKLPALILLYSFIDICAALSSEDPQQKIGKRFQGYLDKYALSTWKKFSSYDLWAARSSLVHTFSPLGDHTSKPEGAKAIFYYAWPEQPSEVTASLEQCGYSNFILVNVNDIKHIAISAFNGLWQRIQSDHTFELLFQKNAQHILKDHMHMKLENEILLIEELKAMAKEQTE